MKKTVILLILFLPVCSLIAQNDQWITKSGDRNDVTVDQFDDVNWSDFDVTGNDNSPSFVTQSGLGSNISDVDQLQNRNSVDVTQVNNNLYPGGINYNVIYQNGNGNYGDVTQMNNDNHPGDVNDAYIYQTGDRNTAMVDQFNTIAPGYPNARGTLDANIHQYGNDGISEQIQKGLRLNATVDQHGRRNESYQVQGASKYVKGEAYTDDAYIYQSSSTDGAKAYQHQVGRQADAEIKQQLGADRSIAIQGQVSSNDRASGPPWRDNNEAIILQQSGVENYAVQLQSYQGSGFPNYATTTQTGSRNSSVVVQIGENNHSYVNVTGNGNESNAWQDNGAARPVLELTLPITWPATYPH